MLRQGSRYKHPQDNPRLVDSLRHTLDFMGLLTARFPCSSFNEVIMVPGYIPDCRGIADEGLLMYSAATRGWAQVFGKDPRPQCVRVTGMFPDRHWLAAVLRSEYTSASEVAAAGGGVGRALPAHTICDGAVTHM